MIEDAQQRDTFLELDEILNKALTRCETNAAELHRMNEAGEDRMTLASREILIKELQFIDAIKAFQARSPGSLLEICFQNVPATHDPGHADSLAEAIANITTVNQQLTEIIAGLADQVSVPDQQEALLALHEQLKSMAQDISMVSVTLDDA